MDTHYTQAQEMYDRISLEFFLELDNPAPNWELLQELHSQLQDMEGVLAACQLDRLV